MNNKLVEEAVRNLIYYGTENGLVEKEDHVLLANGLLDLLDIDPEGDFSLAGGKQQPLEDILTIFLEYAVAQGKIDGGIASRDLFDTRIMGLITPKPSEVIRTFWTLAKNNPRNATDYFYKLCCDCDYIRRYRIAKDQKWAASTEYGDLDITINLSKPEKDPKAIAAALNRKQDAYPKCLLCHENEGYTGRLDHPARQNLRQIPLTLAGEQWYLQYSPYVYYNEHCIVLSEEHRPMKIDRKTFTRLLEFIQMFPHYTVGSNADLPIVGGSILTHEHYQGGNYTFAMAKAQMRESIVFRSFEEVSAGIVQWPMSVIRLNGTNPEELTELSEHILHAWKEYSDPSADILSESEGVPHNTITPIARMRGEHYEMDLVLRNNRTTDQYPLGIFHPHQELHHIKKENIGLIEVMGLAVLPARLRSEMEELKNAMLAGKEIRDIESIRGHADWAEEIRGRHPKIDEDSADRIFQEEIGTVFAKVLEHAGVFKDTVEGQNQFKKFIDSVNE